MKFINPGTKNRFVPTSVSNSRCAQSGRNQRSEPAKACWFVSVERPGRSMLAGEAFQSRQQFLLLYVRDQPAAENNRMNPAAVGDGLQRIGVKQNQAVTSLSDSSLGVSSTLSGANRMGQICTDTTRTGISWRFPPEVKNEGRPANLPSCRDGLGRSIQFRSGYCTTLSFAPPWITTRVAPSELCRTYQRPSDLRQTATSALPSPS